MDNGTKSGIDSNNISACHPRPFGRGLLGGRVKKMSKFLKVASLFAVLFLFAGFVYLLIFNVTENNLQKRSLKSEIRQPHLQEKTRCK